MQLHLLAPWPIVHAYVWQLIFACVVSALLEERALVMAVQQPLAECTAIFIVCIVKHHPPPCAMTIHKTCTDQQWNGFRNSAPHPRSKVNVLATHQTLIDLSQ